MDRGGGGGYALAVGSVKGASLSPSPNEIAHLTLVLGGARSGKSRYAQALLAGARPEAGPGSLVYVATGSAGDGEMALRIARHRAERGPAWETIEVPLDLADALARAGDRPVLVDCLTLWLANLMLGEHDVAAGIAALEAALARRRAATVLVGNEVGLGIVPDNALARRFRDEAGLLHQRLAARAARVVLMAAGLPLVLKGEQAR